MAARDTDICVIGGGPAGSSAALRLAQLGHKVVLVEADPFPRAHVAASLSANCLMLLHGLGAGGALSAAAFPRARPPDVRWGGVMRGGLDGPPDGLHVDRSRFDGLLLELARAAGAQIRQPARAEVPRRGPEGRWRVNLRTPSGAEELTCSAWVDATGRRGSLGRMRRSSAPATALYAYWRYAGDGERGHLRDGASHWCWLAPAGAPGEAIGLVVTDPQMLRASRPEGLEAVYRRCLSEAFPEARWTDAEALSRMRVCDASSRTSQCQAGAGFVRVGDASLCVDPLSSQGVQLAIASALQAAAVVNTFLRRPEQSEAAIEFYGARQAERAEQHRAAAAAAYAEAAAWHRSDFWKSRADGGVGVVARPARSDFPDANTLVELAAGVAFEHAPVLEGDLIVMSRAARARGMARPIAFVAGYRLATMLERVALPGPIEKLANGLAALTSSALAPRLLEWLWQNEFIDPVPVAARGRR